MTQTLRDKVAKAFYMDRHGAMGGCSQEIAECDADVALQAIAGHIGVTAEDLEARKLINDIPYLNPACPKPSFNSNEGANQWIIEYNKQFSKLKGRRAVTITDELLPCPFCGYEAEWQTGQYGDGKEWKHIACSNCECIQPHVERANDNYEHACAYKWNTRAERSRGVVDDVEAVTAARLAFDTALYAKLVEEAIINYKAQLPSPAPLSAEERKMLLAKIAWAVTYVEDAEAALSAIEKHYTLARKL